MVKKALGRDVKPQFLRAQVVDSAANAYTENSFPTPNMVEAGYIMEILKVFWERSINTETATGDETSFALIENTKTAMPNLSDSGTICKQGNHTLLTTSGAVMNDLTGMIDLTDGAGNGVLVGRKELILASKSLSQTNPITTSIAILYRLVKVSAAELIGVISS